jgi:hypothetical protein
MPFCIARRQYSAADRRLPQFAADVSEPQAFFCRARLLRKMQKLRKFTRRPLPAKDKLASNQEIRSPSPKPERSSSAAATAHHLR